MSSQGSQTAGTYAMGERVKVILRMSMKLLLLGSILSSMLFWKSTKCSGMYNSVDNNPVTL